MSASTLHYSLSTIPQVIAAVAAILGAFTFFRIQALERILLGHGQSVLNRWGTEGYQFEDTTQDIRQRKRLVDALDRESIDEIKAVIRLLRDQEEEQGYTLEDRPGGLIDLYDRRFVPTENRANWLGRWTLGVMSVGFFTIITSTVSLAMVDMIVTAKWEPIGQVIVGGNIVLLTLVLIGSFVLARLGLSRDPGGRTPVIQD